MPSWKQQEKFDFWKEAEGLAEILVLWELRFFFLVLLWLWYELVWRCSSNLASSKHYIVRYLDLVRSWSLLSSEPSRTWSCEHDTLNMISKSWPCLRNEVASLKEMQKTCGWSCGQTSIKSWTATAPSLGVFHLFHIPYGQGLQTPNFPNRQKSINRFQSIERASPLCVWASFDVDPQIASQMRRRRREIKRIFPKFSSFSFLFQSIEELKMQASLLFTLALASLASASPISSRQQSSLQCSRAKPAKLYLQSTDGKDLVPVALTNYQITDSFGNYSSVLVTKALDGSGEWWSMLALQAFALRSLIVPIELLVDLYCSPLHTWKHSCRSYQVRLCSLLEYQRSNPNPTFSSSWSYFVIWRKWTSSSLLIFLQVGIERVYLHQLGVSNFRRRRETTSILLWVERFGPGQKLWGRLGFQSRVHRLEIISRTSPHNLWKRRRTRSRQTLELCSRCSKGRKDVHVCTCATVDSSLCFAL